MRQRRRIAAYGLCRDDAGRILLVRAAEHDDIPGVWSLPGGGIGHGEAPLRAVVRELVEETGRSTAGLRLRDVAHDVPLLRLHAALTHIGRTRYDGTVTGAVRRAESAGS